MTLGRNFKLYHSREQDLLSFIEYRLAGNDVGNNHVVMQKKGVALAYLEPKFKLN